MIFRGETFYGTLLSVSAGPDPVSRLYKVEISLPTLHPEIVLGDIIDVILP